MESRNGIIYEFDDFRLIPGEGLLLQNGEPISLSLKAFDTLVLLVERHGHLVQKSELIEEVWEDAFVEEAAVSRCVWTIRNALGEDPKSARFIQTIPRRGYRFVFPVSIVNDHSGAFRLEDLHGHDESDTVFSGEQKPIENGAGNGASPAGTVNTERPVPPADQVEVLPEALRAGRMSSSFLPRWTVLVGLVGIAVITAFVGYYSFVRKSSAPSHRSIVVLPVTPINTADRDVLYEIGIAESLINRLSSAEGLIVRPLSAVRDYSETTKDPITVGLEQKTDYVLVANYQVANGKIKITSQLYNVASGEVEATPQIQMAAAEVFKIQDTVAADFGNQLMQRLGVTASRPVKLRGTNNEEAYRLFIHGRQLYHQTGRFREGTERTPVDVLKEVVALDPNFAEAWATLALAYTMRSTSLRAADGTEQQGATDAINKALAIDPNLSEAYSAKCFAETRFDHDRGASETACRRALDLDPNSGEAHRYFASVLTTLGRHDEAVSEMKTAIDLEPTSANYQRIFGNTLYYARRFDEAAARYKDCIRLDPSDPNNYQQLIKTLEVQGKEPEAFEYLIKLADIQGKDGATIESFRTAYAEAGYRGVLLERIRTSDNRAFWVAGLYAQLSDKDMAFEWLEKAYTQHGWQMIFLETDPQFDSLHNDPRFRDLIRRIQAS